jgi:hypothetical protein
VLSVSDSNWQSEIESFLGDAVLEGLGSVLDGLFFLG